MKNLKKIINKKNTFFLILLIFGLIIGGFLEMVGIGILPAFVLLIARPNQIVEINYLSFLENFLSNLDKSDIILIFSILLIVFFTIKNIYFILLTYLESNILKSITLNNSTNLFKGYLRSPYLMFIEKNPSVFIRNLVETSEHVTSYIRSSILIIKEVIVIIFLFTLLLFSDFQVTIAIFSLLFFISSVFYLTVKKQVKKRGEISQNSRSDQIKLINQSIGSIKYLKISHNEDFFIEKFNKTLDSVLKQGVFIEILGRTPKLFLEVLAISSLLMVVGFFIYFDRSINDMLPFLTLLAVSVIRLVPSFNLITTNLTSCNFNFVAVKILQEEFEYIKKNNEKLIEYSKTNTENFETKELSLNNVCFYYPGYKQSILRNISMKIEIGKTIAIVGPSGAGKSTLIDILLGLLEPTSGEIKINDKPIAENLQLWHKQIGFVPQDIYLNDDTIKSNIAFGQNENEIDENKIYEALKLSKLDEFVNKLPNNISTFIGNRGVKLSGGQLQRLGIARSLYQNPKVLLMDEATSSLDYETENEIIQSINNIKKNKTVIIIAHRQSTIRNSDIIYYLREGELIDQGNFEELKKRNKKFFSKE